MSDTYFGSAFMQAKGNQANRFYMVITVGMIDIGEDIKKHSPIQGCIPKWERACLRVVLLYY